MKKNNFYSTGFAKTGIFAFFVLFLLFINIPAQKQSFTEDELKNLQSNADEKLKTVSYRRITVRYNSGGRGFSSMSVFEFIPPDRSHTITQRKTGKGIVMEERILIGEKAYYRKANEEWKVVTGENDYGGRGTGFGSGSEAKPIQTIEYNFIRGQTIKNQKADLYEIVTTDTYNLENSSYSNTFIKRYWFNEKGLLLKTEEQNKHISTIQTYNINVDYEYNPKNLKIEAPIK